jgi:hypothetical protein
MTCQRAGEKDHGVAKSIRAVSFFSEDFAFSWDEERAACVAFVACWQFGVEWELVCCSNWATPVCVCVYLFAVVLDGLRGGATLDGPRCAANVIATVCQCGIQ